MIVKPGWLYSFFGDGGLMSFPNIVIDGEAMGYADVGAALEASMTSWDDFKWIREAWGGPIVVTDLQQVGAVLDVSRLTPALISLQKPCRSLRGTR